MPQKRKKKSSVSVTESLRRAVLESGKSLTLIAQETGIDLGNLSRFVRGQRWLAPENIDRLAAYLRLVLVRPGAVGRFRRGAARLVLAGAIAASQADPGPVNDAYAALIAVGHTQAEARQLIERVTTSEKTYTDASEILAAVYSSGRLT